MKYKHVSDGRKANSPRNLNELMGFEAEPLLKEGTPEEFEKKIKTLPLHELQTYAVDLAVKPLPDKPRMVRVLVEKYTKLSLSYGGAYEVPKALDADKRAKAAEFLKGCK